MEPKQLARQLLKQETVTGVASTWTICVGVWTVHLCLGVCVSWTGGDWSRELSCVPGLWRSVNQRPLVRGLHASV